MDSQPQPALMRAFAELKRRRVFGTVAAYVVLAALLIELSGAVFDALLFPDWTARLVTVLLILGLPVVAVLSWFFDISRGGIERTPEAGRDASRRDTGLAEALRLSRGAPVPDAPVQRRRRVVADPGPADQPPSPERVREAVLGHIRHELRTPINGILGYTEMLLEDVEDPTLGADLRRIHEAGRRLLDRVDAALLADGAADGADLETFAETVRLDLRTPISSVVGYAEMLKESCEEAGRDELLEDLDRILRSARRLLEVSEDIVRLATRPGADADAFADTSAVAEQLLARIRPVRSGAAAPEGNGRLLVVDDNETNRDLISRQLARFGYTVATATGGQEALDRLRTEEVDLILLDVIMPGLDGVETLLRLNDDDRLSGTPVIMLSSLNELDSAVRCIEMGATDYITKPVEPTLLEARIAAALEVRDLRARELAYRRRVEADGQALDRLLAGAFPSFVLDRVRDGTLQIRERYGEATVLRGILPPDLRPTAGPDGLDRVEAVQALTRALESLAAEHGIDGLVWRPDGFMALEVGGEGGVGPAGAAALALAARDRFEGLALALHVGPLVAGVMGEARPRFEVWGEAVETADALAGHAPAGTTLVTPAARSALGDAYATTPRGVRSIGGRGQMRVYALGPRDEREARVTAG